MTPDHPPFPPYYIMGTALVASIATEKDVPDCLRMSGMTNFLMGFHNGAVCFGITKDTPKDELGYPTQVPISMRKNLLGNLLILVEQVAIHNWCPKSSVAANTLLMIGATAAINGGFEPLYKKMCHVLDTQEEDDSGIARRAKAETDHLLGKFERMARGEQD